MKTAIKPKSLRARAIAKPHSEVGRVRFRLYGRILQRVKSASRRGFHLEAIALIESLIADRLESRLGFLLQRDYSYKNLGDLIKKMGTYECDSQLKALVAADLDAWRILRNESLHEMAKLAEGDKRGWRARNKVNATAAKKGLALFRLIDQRTRVLRT